MQSILSKINSFFLNIYNKKGSLSYLIFFDWNSQEQLKKLLFFLVTEYKSDIKGLTFVKRAVLLTKMRLKLFFIIAK